jgi:hypothetical protein
MPEGITTLIRLQKSHIQYDLRHIVKNAPIKPNKLIANNCIEVLFDKGFEKSISKRKPPIN